MGHFLRETETAPCTVTISHRFEELSAHVRLDNGAVIYPGDTVQVQGPEIMAAFWRIDRGKAHGGHHARQQARTALDPRDG